MKQNTDQQGQFLLEQLGRIVLVENVKMISLDIAKILATERCMCTVVWTDTEEALEKKDKT